MLRSVACLLLLEAAGVYSKPDKTNCNNGAAYDTSTGKASCGGVQVDFFNLLCGATFSQQRCIAKWTNPGGQEEDYFFMAAGSGLSGSMLPTSCNAMPSGLAMVQYYPGSGGCYPAADLAGTQATYTAGSDGTPSSVTLTFAEHDDGSNVRDGYVKITCGQTTSGFTTSGDTNVQAKYEVDVTAPCGGPPAPPGPSPSPGPPGNYRCVNNTCQEGDGGSPYNNCADMCGVATYRCYNNTCVVAPDGGSKSDCQKVCRPPFTEKWLHPSQPRSTINVPIYLFLRLHPATLSQGLLTYSYILFFYISFFTLTSSNPITDLRRL